MVQVRHLGAIFREIFQLASREAFVTLSGAGIFRPADHLLAIGPPPAADGVAALPNPIGHASVGQGTLAVAQAARSQNVAVHSGNWLYLGLHQRPNCGHQLVASRWPQSDCSSRSMRTRNAVFGIVDVGSEFPAQQGLCSFLRARCSVCTLVFQPVQHHRNADCIGRCSDVGRVFARCSLGGEADQVPGSLEPPGYQRQREGQPCSG